MTTDLSRRLELFLLLAFVFFLPLYEAPKNVLWAAYVMAWLANRARARDFGGQWDLWDTLAACWIGSAILAAVFAGVHQDEWRGTVDLVRYVTLFWLVKRGRYAAIELRALIVALIVSTFVALAFAFWSYYVTHARPALELNSVGHVNHSSIYLIIAYGAALAAVLAYWNSIATRLRVAGVAVVLLFAASVFINESRAAAAALLLGTLLLGVAWLRRSRKPLVVFGVVVLLTAVSAVSLGFSVVKKHQRDVEMNLTLAYRDVIWNGAIEVARRFPVFGAGMNNFAHIGHDQLREYVTTRGGAYDANRYYPTSHAHNLFLTTLAERGAVGLAALVAVLAAWAYWLVKRAPGREEGNLEWALWGAAASAWLFTCGIGLFNTTLHHEHALLSVMLLGMWLSHLGAKQPRATRRAASVPARPARRKRRAAATRRASRTSKTY